MSKKPEKSEPADFQKRLDELAKSRKEKEAFSFPENKTVVVYIEGIKPQDFTRGSRDWISLVYRGYQIICDEKGAVTGKQPITFFGNTVLDGHLKENEMYMVTYWGKEKDYHNYTITSTSERELRELASQKA